MLGDAQTWIAFGALLISVVSLGYSHWIHKRGNSRWKSLNRPRMRLTNPHLRSFGMVEEDLLPHMPPEFPAYNVDELGPAAVKAFGQLVWWNLETGELHRGHRTCFTIREAMAEKVRAGLPEEYALVKYIEYRMPFENIGILPAMNVRGRLIVSKDGEHLAVQEVGPGIILRPEEETTVTAFVGIPLDQPLPDHLDLTLELSYDDDEGATYSDRLRRRWVRSSSVFKLRPDDPRVDDRLD